MTFNDKVSQLIQSLIQLSKGKKIEWTPIPEFIGRTDNFYAKKYLIEHNRYIYSPGIHSVLSEYSSFACSIANGTVFLTTFIPAKKDTNYFVLAYQEKTNRPIKELNSRDLFQEELSVLFQHVVEREDEGLKFIEDIISASEQN